MNNAYHYNAFISYNHNPRDSKVAEIIQQKLEHYRVPKSLRENSGLGDIKRIFLDKGELEAGELNEKILWALEHSEFLIVICSPETVSSPWVKKEIDYFLRFHEKKNILAVLTEGEPANAFPEALLFDEIKDDNGQTLRTPREPLASDYRGNIRHANRTELPRLAAALIGCRYDELMQRQRHYRMVRYVVIASATFMILATALVYFIWSNKQINDNYLQSLREQSHSLSIESEEALNEGDRIEAARLALKALPSDNKDRPILSGAVNALSQSIDLYRNPSSESLQAQRSFGTYDRVLDLIIVGEKEQYYIAALTNLHNLKIWDGKTGAEKGTSYADTLSKKSAYIDSIVPAGDEQILLKIEKDLRLFDIGKNREVWKHTSKYTLSPIFSPVVSGNAICIVGYNDEKAILLKYDLKTGKETFKTNLAEPPKKIALSPDGTLISGWYTEDRDGHYIDRVFTVDTGSGKVSLIKENNCLCDIKYTADGNLAITSLVDRPDDFDMSQYDIADIASGSSRMVFTTSTERDVTLEVCNPETGEEIWKDQFRDTFHGLPKLTLPGSDEVNPNLLICTIGNVMRSYDRTGRLEYRLDFDSSVVSYWPTYTKEKDGKIIRAVLQNGQLAAYTIETGELTTMNSVFRSPIINGDTHLGHIVLSCTKADEHAQRETILQYAFGGRDPRWKDYNQHDDLDLPDSLSYEDSFVSWDVDTDQIVQVIRRDSKTGKILWTANHKSTTILPKYAGKDDSTGMIWFAGTCYENLNKAVHAIGIRLSDGKIIEKKIPWNGSTTEFPLTLESLGASNEKLFFLTEKTKGAGTQHRINSLDLTTGDIVAAKLDIDQPPGDVLCLDNEHSRLFLGREKSIEVLTMDGKKEDELKVSFTPQALAFTDSGDLIVGGKDQDRFKVALFEQGKTRTNETALTNVDADALLFQFSALNLPEGNILISVDNTAYVIGGEDWGVTSTINEFQAYNPNTRLFYIRNSGDEQGCVPYCTLEEMVDMGEGL